MAAVVVAENKMAERDRTVKKLIFFIKALRILRNLFITKVEGSNRRELADGHKTGLCLSQGGRQRHFF